ncbi:hypothetical protein [Dyella sp.]|uniref:hypothetical protein n=1 Tax=Dyella sp. TaxID=1869338 RepID=UPI00283BB684|nr:hypothetical protein [Dyella sp.]MDR3446657.1 hypothetical protein [Dyella sp.]
MKKYFIALVIGTLAISGLARADELVVAGAGTMSCGKYVAASVDKALASVLGSWAQGYLSGLNMLEHDGRGKPFRALPDYETIDLYIVKYCRDHPLSYPYVGAQDMFEALPVVSK